MPIFVIAASRRVVLTPRRRDQVEACGVGSQDRAEGVQGIESADLPPQDLDRSDKKPTEHRQRRAHQRRGDQEDQKNEQELRQAESQEGQPERPMERDVDVFSPRKKERRDECVNPDPDFEQSVESEGAGVRSAIPPER